MKRKWKIIVIKEQLQNEIGGLGKNEIFVHWKIINKNESGQKKNLRERRSRRTAAVVVLKDCLWQLGTCRC